MKHLNRLEVQGDFFKREPDVHCVLCTMSFRQNGPSPLLHDVINLT
jgi:hypothetical protein